MGRSCDEASRSSYLTTPVGCSSLFLYFFVFVSSSSSCLPFASCLLHLINWHVGLKLSRARPLHHRCYFRLLTSLIVLSQSPWFYPSNFFTKKPVEEPLPESSPPNPEPQTPPPPSLQPPKTESTDDDVEYWSWPPSPRFHCSSPIQSTTTPKDDICAPFPTHLLSNIQVTLKIGASEPSERLTAQLTSVSKCIPNLLVASDMDSIVDSRTAFDVLADLPPSLQDNNADFDAYHAQKEPLKSGDFNRKGGWRLDKYKFLPMVEYAHASNPSAEWYVFLESDTFIIWDNLFQLLDRFDPRVPLYFGSPSPGRTPPGLPKTWFAYGGAGFVVSAAAVKKLLDRETGAYGELVKPGINAQYERDLRGECCGDSMLGWALWEHGVTLSGLFPMFNPHPLRGIPFAERFWCQPAISMHKTRWRRWGRFGNGRCGGMRVPQRPILYADIAAHIGLGTFEPRKDWDNADWDGWQEPDDSPAHKSVDGCASECRKHGGCFQYTFRRDRCTFVRSFRLGQRKDPEGEEDWSEEEKVFHAGWDNVKIKQWMSEHTCEEARWVKPSTKRIF
ncbi:uncharacterized protein BDZ99DRAFT_503103 [Mytilinidion resinicola]|uniref:N-acetylgalactosaminide beta-1,3-galactosyltransferase n=1 Tax=Mytilinidion resinicola TaxID=574789 RepID=A0A6A6Y3Q0_9PEZI|nr:uncharacterized protein BDZ99DRAFT_503103 [Mytilinidion resinicola]KAF2803461.1 hypothetical protein BDZ99DRAFT_503103 [Mytilinidion resinicola]